MNIKKQKAITNMGPWPESLGIYKEPFRKMDPFSCTWQWMQHNLLVPDWLRLCPADQQALNKVPCIEIKSLEKMQPLSDLVVGSCHLGLVNSTVNGWFWHVFATCTMNFYIFQRQALPRAHGGGKIVEKTRAENDGQEKSAGGEPPLSPFQYLPQQLVHDFMTVDGRWW